MARTEATPSPIISEPEKIYHSKARQNLSSHQLADFRKCAELYHRKQLGLIPDEDRPSYVIGRAAHCLILEGEEKFDATYVVGGPVNPSTHKPYGATSKKYREWADAQDKDVLTDAQNLLVTQLAEGVAAHKRAQEFLSRGLAEGVVREEYCGEPSQIRIDWFSPEHGIVDLKTADDLTWFENDARKFGYAYQMAFYRAVLAKALGKEPTDIPVHIIAVEKKEPFRCGVWLVTPDVLANAQKENEEAIELLAQCREAKHWPTGYEQVRTFDYI